MTTTTEPNDTGSDGGGESLLTVLLALAANAAVAVLKLVAGLVTGSGAMLSEAAHSLGDCSTEIFLLVALRRSTKQADRLHPFGYGKARYFWSLVAAGMIFVLGGAFSAYEGLHTILNTDDLGQESPTVAYLVLAGSAVLEGISLAQGIRQARGAAADGNRSFRAYLRNPDDPTVKSVVLEDSAALIGLTLAGLGVGLHHLTGSAVWDGLASLAISALLVAVAFTLVRTCAGLLIGRQADPRLIGEIIAMLEREDEVLDVVDVLTMQLGAGRVLLCARVDFIDTYTSGDLERACVRMAADLEMAFPVLVEIFLEPVPRTDADLRENVRARYGRAMADPA
ncbi:MAG: cation diffusion facilitator family transporter [Pseudonocardiales bacterium]|nr:cation diffusion facilitator family transporter [Pseudonocardiales bacterium]